MSALVHSQVVFLVALGQKGLRYCRTLDFDVVQFPGITGSRTKDLMVYHPLLKPLDQDGLP